MTDPTQLTDSSPRFGLPLLFAGQAQKEFSVNEAHALTDILLHSCVEAIASVAPASPESGQSWLIEGPAQGNWTGRENQIAAYLGGEWLFVRPQIGMRIFNRQAGQFIIFNGSWQKPEAPSEAMGGQTIDTELRGCFVSLVASLRQAGIFPATE